MLTYQAECSAGINTLQTSKNVPRWHFIFHYSLQVKDFLHLYPTMCYKPSYSSQVSFLVLSAECQLNMVMLNIALLH